MKVLAIGTSNNHDSINRTLASYAAGLPGSAQVTTVDIHDYEMPIFSDAREQRLGQPEAAQRFFRQIGEADALVVSFAEHNGGYTAAYKNLFDWTSRIDRAVFQGKPAVFLSASPGPGGATSVLSSALDSAGYFGARVIASLSVPDFERNFDLHRGVMRNSVLRQNLTTAMQLLEREVLQDISMQRESYDEPATALLRGQWV